MTLLESSAARPEPRVGLILQADLPAEWLDEFRADLNIVPADLEVRQIYSAPMAGVLLYMMQGAMIFVASKYFGAMASEAGKDHYKSLKNAVFKLWLKLKHVKVTTFSTSEIKARGSEIYQLAFSMNGHARDGSNLKLIFQIATSDEISEIGMNKFIELLGRMNTDTATDEDTEKLAQCASIGRTRVLTVDKITGELIPADPIIKPL